MSKTFIVERDVLLQHWCREQFTVEGVDKEDAIRIFKLAAADEIEYSTFKHVDVPIKKVGNLIISSHINADKVVEIPTQHKLKI
jgi:hypothetical protein